jgi:general transcriptional corepressor CYC8
MIIKLMTDPKDPAAWYTLGRYYMQRLNYSKAYEAYQQAVYRDSRNSNFWCSIGVLYWEINQFRDALDAYTRAIRLNPYIPEIWFNLGTLYEACNNQVQDAIDAYNRAWELDNDYHAVSERLAILKRNLETGRSDGPPPPRPSDIDPQRYEDFLQSQANQQQAAQLQGLSGNQWGPPAQGPPPQGPPNQHRPMHQPPPQQHPQYPPRRSPDQLKSAPYSHPPSSYSNGSSGYGRQPTAPPVTIKRGSSPVPPQYGYDARPPMGEPPQHQGYPRHDEMSHRPPHPQSYSSPRQHERDMGGPMTYPPPASRSPVSYSNRGRSPPSAPAPISQHGPPPDVKPIMDQGPPPSPGDSHNVQLAPLQSMRSPQPNIPSVPRNDAAAYPPLNDAAPKRWESERDYSRAESSRSSPHTRVEEQRPPQERHEEHRLSPPQQQQQQSSRSHDPTPRPRSPLISPRTTTEPSYISPPVERKSPLVGSSRMEIDSPEEKVDKRSASGGDEGDKMQIEEDKRPEVEAPARAMEVDEDYDKEDDKPEEK